MDAKLNPSNKRLLMKSVMRTTISVFLIIFFIPKVWGSDFLFNTYPDWVSSALNHVATGLGVADINGDGWDDIIVANGNDILRQNLCVYYNQGDGTFPVQPSWSSADIDYHGHLAVGDVNADGFVDVAVSVFSGPDVFVEPGQVKLYCNVGGELEATPSFRSADSMFTFSCALGDADGDGDLDLAVAGGQAYAVGAGPYKTYGRVYFNENGVLDALPGWTSNVTMGALDVDFADMDGNGYLDLIFANHLTPNYIFLADEDGALATVPGWKSLDESYFANSLTIARITDDPYPDLILSDNRQLGGEGRFKAYLFGSSPAGKTYPSWQSGSGGYGSAVIAGDLNADGFIDLAAGRWWGRVEIYDGMDHQLSSEPAWSSVSSSVIEAFALRDLDQDGWQMETDTIRTGENDVHVLNLPTGGIERILSVVVNHSPLQAGIDYVHIPGTSWISTRMSVDDADLVEVTYIRSEDRDLVLSNWDRGKGNYIFYNQRTTTNVAEAMETDIASHVHVYPNPFNSSTTITYTIPATGHVKIEIFNTLGRKVATLENAVQSAGAHHILFNADGLASGSYFYRFMAGRVSEKSKMIILR
jgi:hypothetical protein